MVLSDFSIYTKLNKKELVDLERSEDVTLSDLVRQINPNSLDLTIGREIMRPNGYMKPITYGEDFCAERYWTRYEEDGDILLKRGEVILASTREFLTMPANLCGQVFTKSTAGRLFIHHMMAGVVDAGFSGRLTLALRNDGCHDVLIPVGSRPVQLVIYETDEPVAAPYGEIGGRYHGYMGPMPALGTPTNVNEE